MTAISTPSPDWFTFGLGGELEEDHYALLARKRTTTPIEYVHPFGGRTEKVGMHAVYRYEDVRAVLLNQTAFSLDVAREYYAAVLGQRTLFGQNWDRRRVYRGLLASRFGNAQKVTDLARKVVEPLADELIGGLRSQASADLMPALCEQLPVRTVVRLVGLPEDHWPTIAGWVTASINFMDHPKEAVKASYALRRTLRELVAERRQERRDDDFVSELIDARVDDEPLSDKDIVAILVLLVWAGTETTTHALATLIYALMTHPDQLGAISSDDRLLPKAIEEILRWESPIQVTCRSVQHDVEVCGRVLPAGAIVLAHIGSANRDPEIYTNPDELDLYRTNLDKHLGFGMGAHRCVGLQLARLEMQTVATGVFEAFPRLHFDSQRVPRMLGRVTRAPEHLSLQLR